MAVLKAVGDGEAAIELLVLTSDSDRDAYPYPGGAAREFLAGFGPVRLTVENVIADNANASEH